MDLGFTDRVAVVTGGSSGIGLATVGALLDEGAKVAFFARDEARLNEALDRLKAVHGDRVHAEPCDVLDKDAVAGFRDSVARTFGKADVLINNAGQARWSTFAETTDEDWRAELELKYFSVINPIRVFLPDLEASDAGAVVMVNSLLARQPEPHLVATASARAGILSLVKSLSTEFAPKGIRVNSILVGTIATGQWEDRFKERAPEGVAMDEWFKGLARDRGIPLARFGRPEEAAAAVLFLASGQASFITGVQMEVAGGVSRFA